MSNEDLRSNIARLEDDELLVRWHSGTVTEEAKPIFLDEIVRRGIDVSKPSADQVLYEQERVDKPVRRSQTNCIMTGNLNGNSLTWTGLIVRILFCYVGNYSGKPFQMAQ